MESKELYQKVMELESEVGIGVDRIERLYQMICQGDRVALAYDLLASTYRSHCYDFPFPELGSEGLSIVCALYGIDKPYSEPVRKAFLLSLNRKGVEKFQYCFNAAKTFATKAIELEPKFGIAYWHRALINFNMGEEIAAKSDCDKAILYYWDSGSVNIGSLEELRQECEGLVEWLYEDIGDFARGITGIYKGLLASKVDPYLLPYELIGRKIIDGGLLESKVAKVKSGSWWKFWK